MSVLKGSADDAGMMNETITERAENEVKFWTDETVSEKEETATSLYDKFIECNLIRTVPSYGFALTTLVCIPILLCMIGLCGNIVTFCALRTDPDKNNASTFLLKVLTIVDSLLLLSNVVRGCCMFLKKYTLLKFRWSYIFLNSYPIVEYFHFYFQSLSACSVLLVTIDRYIAACLPYRQHLRSMRRMKIAVFILLITIALLTIIGNIRSMTATVKRVHYSNCVNFTWYSFSHEPRVHQLVWDLHYASYIINRVPPMLSLVVLIVLNIILIVRLRHQNSLHRSSSSRSDRKQDNKMLVMTIVVVLVFCICTVPITIGDFINMIEHFTGTDIMPWRVDRYCFYLVFVVLAVNSSVNFFIYCLVWTKFRGLISNLWS